MPSEPSSPTRADLARELLRYKMMEYSQDGFCATWLVDLEWDLWRAAEQIDPSPAQEYTIKVSQECRQLAEIAGGWWVYEDETCPREPGPVFVSSARWQEILEKHQSSQ